MNRLLLTVIASLALVGAPSARVHTLVRSPEDVKAHGAVGDGHADDTKAFQDTLAAAKAAHTEIYLPAGHYRITQPLSGFSDFTLYGDGPTSEVIYEREQTADDKGWDHGLFNFHDEDHNINFRQIRLSYKGTFSVGGPKESYAGRLVGIYLPKVHDVVIEKADISGFNSYGIHQTTADKTKYSKNIEVRQCKLHNTRVSGFRFDYVDGCRILDCDLYENGHPDDPGTGYGIAGSSGGRPKNVTVKGCRAYNNKRVGIDFHVGDTVTIENNTIYGTANSRLGNQNGIYLAETFGTNKILNNHIRTLRDRGETSAYLVYGLRIGYPYTGNHRNPEKVSVLIKGNTIEDFDVSGGKQFGYPIFMDNTFSDLDLTIQDNEIDAPSCFSIININDHPGYVKQCQFNIQGNRFTVGKLGYLPVRVSNATDVRFDGNTVDIQSSDQPRNHVFSIAAPGPGLNIYCSGNTVTVPPTWNSKGLLPPGFTHTGIGNTINGSIAD